MAPTLALRHQLGYLAGFIDGEGYIGLSNERPQIILSNTNKHALEEIKRLFGGNLYFIAEKRSNRKDSYRLQYTGQKALGLLYKVYDKLIIKHRQALWLLLYESQRKSTRDPKLLYKIVYDNIRALNKKGK